MTSPAQQQIDRIAATGGAAAAAAASTLYNGLGASIPNPLGAVADVGLEVARIATAVSRASVWISNPRNLLRIGYVIGGAILIAIGTAMIVSEGKKAALNATGVGNLIGIGTKIVSKGKVGNAAA
jgi:hypothetical protein